MKRTGALALPITTNEGLEVVRLISEKNQLYALVKLPVEDLPNLRVLKTDKERREYQRQIQTRYRQRLKGRPRRFGGR